jgi:ABC-type Fe3+ transport system permease subunit
VTLPLVMPGVAGAAIFVFAEMLGSFAAAFVLGIPARFVVITTAIWQAVTMYPADYGRAAAHGIGLFAVMFLMLRSGFQNWRARRPATRNIQAVCSRDWITKPRRS